MRQGCLAIVLHAHLPYVRHSEHDDSLEERWLYEAITESYVPLFLVLEKLIEDGIDFRLTFSISPTLASMLGDPLLQSRYLRRLEQLIELAEKEETRTRSDQAFHPLAQMYRALFVRVREAFVNRYSQNLLNAFRRFEQLGKVDLMTTAATHAYLPLLSVNESAVRAQIHVGLEHHKQIFGRKVQGFWLPECGYYPGVDALLREQEVLFTILETHGITRADRRPRYGVYAPIYTPAGLAAFGRDPDSSRQVWSSVDGYPGDYDYREFYRDVGHDLELGYIQPYIHRDGIRLDTGIKYFRITGKDNHKEPYVPEWAERKAESHAEHFLAERRKQLQRLTMAMDRTPIIVAPYDAELFGHWWFEGPRWLDHLIRKIARERETIRLVTLPEYLDESPVNQMTTPCMSSWGYKGFSEAWLNQNNHWIYPHLHMAAEMMEKMAAAHPHATGPMLGALKQAAKELMLAQASDWTFMMSTGAMKEYAVSRSQDHLLRFHRLKKQIENGVIDKEQLALPENRDNLFGKIDPARAFANSGTIRGADTEFLKVQNSVSVPRITPTVSVPRRLHIVMVSPEVVPFAKTGGLADMVSSLAIALQQLGQQVTLITPAYRSVLNNGFPLRYTGTRVAVSTSGRTEEAQVFTTVLDEHIQVYLIRADRYFDRDYLYATPEGDYADNAERFAFFARAALELLGGMDFPDVLHAHDWQAALAIALLKTQPERYPGLASIRTVFTLHNLGYQGLFSPDQWHLLDLDPALFSPEGLEFYGKINFLKGGLVFAEALTTVSPTYAQEIRTSEYGFGLEGIFQQRSANLVGIMNGVDYKVWNPATDPFIAQQYTADDPSGKRPCKAALQAAFGLAQDSDIPLLGAISRLTSQKGFDLLEAALDELLRRDVQFVLLGTGDAQHQDYFRSAAARYPGRVGVRIAYEEVLAHKIEAGADMFLMPSRYEPSGLTQLYSLKYGTIPVVRATGGLKDTIEEFDPATGKGNGFCFKPYEASAFLAAVNRALAVFQNKNQWKTLMTNAMTADYSWSRSASEYLNLYRRLLKE